MFSCDFVIDSTFLVAKILNFLCIASLSPFLLSLTTIKLVEIPIFARFSCYVDPKYDFIIDATVTTHITMLP